MKKITNYLQGYIQTGFLYQLLILVFLITSTSDLLAIKNESASPVGANKTSASGEIANFNVMDILTYCGYQSVQDEGFICSVQVKDLPADPRGSESLHEQYVTALESEIRNIIKAKNKQKLKMQVNNIGIDRCMGKKITFYDLHNKITDEIRIFVSDNKLYSLSRESLKRDHKYSHQFIFKSGIKSKPDLLVESADYPFILIQSKNPKIQENLYQEQARSLCKDDNIKLVSMINQDYNGIPGKKITLSNQYTNKTHSVQLFISGNRMFWIQELNNTEIWDLSMNN